MHSHLDKPENLRKRFLLSYLTFRATTKSQLLTESDAACFEVISALEECHARGFLWKSLGMCNDPKKKVNECLWAQRLKRATANREEARARRDRIKKSEEELGL